jgi:hypothetical protein
MASHIRAKLIILLAIVDRQFDFQDCNVRKKKSKDIFA